MYVKAAQSYDARNFDWYLVPGAIFLALSTVRREREGGERERSCTCSLLTPDVGTYPKPPQTQAQIQTSSQTHPFSPQT